MELTCLVLQSRGQTCPAGVRGEVMGVGRLQALLHLLEEIFDLILDFLLEYCAHLRRTEGTLNPSRLLKRKDLQVSWSPVIVLISLSQ